MLQFIFKQTIGLMCTIAGTIAGNLLKLMKCMLISDQVR